MIYVAVLVMGIISWLRIPQELYPNIVFPNLTVFTTYSNAAPEEIESLITSMVEEAVSTVKHLRRVRSISREGVSLVMAEFSWSADLEFAALSMREKIDMIKERLPRDADEPVVLKFNPFARPIMVLSYSGDGTINETRLLKTARDIIKERLEKIPGVASANISGGRDRQILVEIDQDRLRASGIDIIKVSDAIKNANLNYPAGTTKESYYEYLIRTIGEYESIDEIEATIVDVKDSQEQARREQERKGATRMYDQVKRRTNLRPVRVKDVARVKDTLVDISSYSRYNGSNNISISIQKQADANIIKTVELVKRELSVIGGYLPKNTKLDVFYDQSTFILNSIHEVVTAGWQGALLAFLVLLVMLRKVRDAMIVTATIPTSVMVTIMMMYFSGISINMMSLGGLVLGIGMLVDNGTVVVENIFRKRTEDGMAPKDAAIAGAEEVSGAVFSSTLTTVAVFLPTIFVIGIAGQLFKDISFTVVFSLTASYLVSITLVPMLCKDASPKTSTFDRILEPMLMPFDTAFLWIGAVYEHMLLFALKNKVLVLMLSFALFCGSLLLMGAVEKVIMPEPDQGQFTVKVTMPTGTRVEKTNEVVEKIEKMLLKQKLVSSISVTVGSQGGGGIGVALQALGSHQAEMIVNLDKPLKKKMGISTKQFMATIKHKVKKLGLPGFKEILQENEFGAAFSGGADIVLEVKGKELDEMEALVNEIKEKISAVPDIEDIKDTIPEPSPEMRINVRRNKAALYDLDVLKISQRALIAIRGIATSKFKEEGRDIPIVVRLHKKDVSDIKKLQGITIFSPNDVPISLNEVAELSKGRGPSEIERFDQQRVFQVKANRNISSEKSIQDLQTKLLEITDNVKLPSGYTVTLGGQTEEMRESFNSLIFAMILSVCLVYMIMAGQFESLWQPFVIMFSVPLSVIGVSVALYFTNTALSVTVMLGIIMLSGVVVNNGIVLIDFINLLREQGYVFEEAIIEAGKKRLRPILITMLTTVLGLLPMAISGGEGAELRAPMAITVMGGLFVATFLTLIVIPLVLYIGDTYVFSRLKKSAA